jgi:hypothetical protein
MDHFEGTQVSKVKYADSVKVLFGTFEYSDYVYWALELMLHQWLSKIVKRIITGFMFK